MDILTAQPDLRREVELELAGGMLTYADVMRDACGLERARFAWVDGSQERFPDPSEFRGVIVGGSFENPVEGQERPWMFRTYEFLRDVAERRMPLLGICGGMEFVARALGAEVLHHPAGRHFGTRWTTVTAEGGRDPLLEGMPRTFPVQVSHQCIVGRCPPTWTVLASSDACPIEALAAGDSVRLVQFHPELTCEHMRAIARWRRPILLAEGRLREPEFPALLASILQSGDSQRVLRNFLDRFVHGRS